MNAAVTETEKKGYTPAFTLDDLDLSSYGIAKKDLTDQNIRSLENRNRTSVLQLPDPANNALKVEGRLLVKKIEGKWTIYPEYKNSAKLEIHDTILGATITAEDKKNLLEGKVVVKDLTKDGKTFSAAIVIDKELNRLLIIPQKSLPKTLLNTILSEQQVKDLFAGKSFLLKGTSKDGKTIARMVNRDPITGHISYDYPNAKGEALNKTQSTKVEPAVTVDGKVTKEKVETKVEVKTEPTADFAPAQDLDVYKDKMNARKQTKEAKEAKPKKKATVKL